MRFMFWRGPKAEERQLISISDPAFADLLGIGPSDAGVRVTTSTAMNLTAVNRAVSLTAGTIAGLPLHTYEDRGDGQRARIPSIYDDPGRFDGLTRFEWLEFVMMSLLLHGNAHLLHVYSGARELLGLTPVHPNNVTIDVQNGSRLYRVTRSDGTRRTFGSADLTHVMGLSTDGVRGLSPMTAGRQAIGTALAGDKAAARMFRAPMISGLVTAEEDVTETEAKTIDTMLKNRMSGTDHAGEIAFVNRKLRFTPWTMTAEDAKFIESRSFQVVEIARLFGLPPILLADTEKTTSWGAGVQEIIRGWAKFTLSSWAHRIEERLSRLLPDGQFVEFDFAGLLQGDQAQVTENLIKEVGAGLLTINEARAILNRPPIEGGDDTVLLNPGQVVEVQSDAAV